MVSRDEHRKMVAAFVQRQREAERRELEELVGETVDALVSLLTDEDFLGVCDYLAMLGRVFTDMQGEQIVQMGRFLLGSALRRVDHIPLVRERLSAAMDDYRAVSHPMESNRIQ